MSVINTNVAANNTYRLMSQASEDKASSMEKLSSGLRINRAADDAAGLSIAEGLKSQASGLEVAARNAGDAVSLIQTAEGGLSAAHDILQRMRDLAVQGANDTNNAEARTAIATEIGQLGEELVRMSDSIKFNDISLLDGTRAPGAFNHDGDDGTTGLQDGTLKFQIGANGGEQDQIELNLANANLLRVVGAGATADNAGTPENEGVAGTSGLGIGVVDATTQAVTVSTAHLTTAAAFSTFLEAVDTQITQVSTARAELGATQNRLEHTLKHVNVTAENLTNAESRIRDVDMAKEIVKQSAASIKEQASQAMLAQANQASQGVLQLLR